MWVSLIILFHERLKGSLEGSGCPHPHRRHPFHPSASWLIISLWSLLIPYTYLTAVHTASQGQHKIPETWSQLAVPGQLFTVEKISLWYSARLAVLGWGRRKICKGFGGMWPLAPPAPSPPTREAAACPQGTPPPAQEWKDLTVLPGAAWKGHMEDPRDKQEIHSWQTAATKKPKSESPQLAEPNQIWI